MYIMIGIFIVSLALIGFLFIFRKNMSRKLYKILLLSIASFFVVSLCVYSYEQIELKKQLLDKEYYENGGVSIDDVRESLNENDDEIILENQDDYLQKTEHYEKTYEEKAYEIASIDYYNAWEKVCENNVFDSSEIECLKKAINDLADSTINLNDSKFYKLIIAIDGLDDLKDKLINSKVEIDIKVTGLKCEYNEILYNISECGGVATKEQKDRMAEIASEINSCAIKGNSYDAN